MKGILFFMIAVLCISFLHAREVIVYPSQNLQQVFNETKDYDTIVLKPGIYACINYEIKKPLTLIGENFPVLDGQLKDEVLVVMSDDVSINGIEIRNTKCGSMKDFAGIHVINAKNAKIENCKLNKTFFGIYLSGCKNALVKNCRSIGTKSTDNDTGNGIRLWKCDSINIENNSVEAHRDGIYIEFAKNCIIRNNICVNNLRYGLHFMFSDNDTYENNTFSNNGTGVAVMYSKGVGMFNNKFENNWGDASYGLLLKDMTNGSIVGNIFENNTVGVTMEGGTNMHFEKNNFKQNGYAIKVMANCRLDTFVRNNFSENTFDASTNGELKENLFENNFWDKYEGYDLNRDAVGDIPYRPVSLYSMLVEQMPYAVMLMRSFTIDLLNRAERNIPSIVPQTFVDEKPLMKMITQK